MEAGYLAAFVVGLVGGVHCLGMCGGIVGALTLGLGPEIRERPSRMLPYLLAYNGGRIASYALAGLLVGGVGWFAANLLAVHEAQRVLLLMAAAFMVALGLYLAGWWQGLARLERAGGVVWRRLEPLGRRFLPVRRPRQALGLGLVWGWLPCGLVYSVLVWALAAGGPLEGFLLMLSFGLGTLPNLLLMGAFAGVLARWVQRPAVRAGAGLLVMALGLYTAYTAVGGGG
ncbi:sulfite exporter TauE/SafE family protein [Ectothiorhodospiraceae bacterium 2226]|nr:sulfite exporter TauE/SafE family protein [Ectothiorhodospiraceae bacterium 2226]